MHWFTVVIVWLMEFSLAYWIAGFSSLQVGTLHPQEYTETQRQSTVPKRWNVCQRIDGTTLAVPQSCSHQPWLFVISICNAMIVQNNVSLLPVSFPFMSTQHPKEWLKRHRSFEPGLFLFRWPGDEDVTLKSEPLSSIIDDITLFFLVLWSPLKNYELVSWDDETPSIHI